MERTPVYEYRIMDAAKEQMGESSVIGVELVDELVNQLFGMHFLEPIVFFDERLKVRPIVKNMFKP